MWKKYLCVLGVACLVGGLSLKEARACQPEPPSVDWISLTDNATGLPTNASIWVMHRGSYDPNDLIFTYELKGPSGAITLKQEWNNALLRLTPEQPLTANTSYTFSASCTGQRCYGGLGEKKATFTTGTEAWSQSKPYAGASDARSSQIPPYKAQHMCEASHNGYFRISISGPEVPHAAYYNLYRLNSPTATVIQWQKPSGSIRSDLSNGGQEHCFQLRAVDHAGHEDQNATKACVTPVKTATETTTEPGTEPTTETTSEKTTGDDGGPTDTAQTTDKKIDVRVGCGCQAGHQSPSLSLFLLFFFLLASGIRTATRR